MGKKTKFLLFLKFLISSMILFWQTSLHSMISFDSSSSFEHHTIQMYGSMNFKWKTIYIYLFLDRNCDKKKTNFFFANTETNWSKREKQKSFFFLFLFGFSNICIRKDSFPDFFVVVVVTSNLLTRRRVVFFCWFIL